MYILLADFFVENGINGGSELNNHEFSSILSSNGKNIDKVNTFATNLDFLKTNSDKKFIVANFVNLPKQCKDYMTENLDYVIYEHDHKYLESRDPSVYEDYICPEEKLINLDFYKNAIGVFCQSRLHKNILEKNIKSDNIFNLSGNLWNLNIIKMMDDLSKVEKADFYSIMYSPNPIKNTHMCIKYCDHKNLAYKLVPHMPYVDFIRELSKNKGLVFFPNVVETLNRVCVEARMMNCEVVTNKKVGATSEPWFKLKGKDLIDEVRIMRDRIPRQIIQYF